jgi:hypothetical protein
MLGIATSIVVFAVGAVLNFAVTMSTAEHGFNIHTVGVILMIAAAIGFVISVIAVALGSERFRHRSTVIDDGTGHVIRRDDRYV